MKECREQIRLVAAAACAVWSDVAGIELVLPAAPTAAPEPGRGPCRALSSGGRGRHSRDAQGAGAGRSRSGARQRRRRGGGRGIPAGSRAAGRGAGPACRRRSSQWTWGSWRRTTSLRSSRLKVPGGGGTGREAGTRQAAACRRDCRGLGRPGRAGTAVGPGRPVRRPCPPVPAHPRPLPGHRCAAAPQGPAEPCGSFPGAPRVPAQPQPGQGLQRRQSRDRARSWGSCPALCRCHGAGHVALEVLCHCREGCEQMREKFTAVLALEMRIARERKDEGWKLSVKWKNV